MQFGDWLRSLRESRRLRLRDVEKLAEGKISNAYLSQLEGGKVRNPSIAIAATIAKVYDVPCVAVIAAAGYPVKDGLIALQQLDVDALLREIKDLKEQVAKLEALVTWNPEQPPSQT